MDVRTKRRVAVWVLLSVFVPMLVLSSLHVHQSASEAAAVSCSDCANHIAHAGHLSLQTVHSTSCVLCQFVSLPFVLATALTLAVASALCTTQFFVRLMPCQTGISLLHQPRAPPAIC